VAKLRKSSTTGVLGERGRARRRQAPPAISVRPAPKAILAAMAKVCHVCKKGPSFGNSRSHSMVATRRRFDPNLQRVRIDDDGTPRRVYVCTRCLKAGKVAKAL
jgi:large subunit ribosomal protein L28